MRFQAGGTLQEGHFYIERDADEELLRALTSGAFCHVLAPRQIGKSSLCRRAERRLKEAGARCLTFAMSSLGTESSAEDWYFTVVDKLAGGLGLEDPLDYWERHGRLTVVERWSRYLREQVLRLPGEIYLFLDEIDALRDLRQFRPDDFFASLRELFNDRSVHADYARLRLCLVGTAAPTELLRTGMTPFNVSRGIRLRDFTLEQVQGFLPGLEGLEEEPEALLRAVVEWTDGHPYMTQRLCEALTGPEGKRAERAAVRVRALVEGLFLRHGSRSDPNLEEAQRRFDLEVPDAPRPEKIALYQRLLHGEVVSSDFGQRIQEELLLAGMIKESPVRPGTLRVRNRVFSQVLGLDWLREREADRYFADALNLWLMAHKDQERLLRGQELALSETWAEGKQLSALEQEYLERSRAQRAVRGLMRAGMVLAVMVIGVLGGLLWNTQRLLAAREQMQGERDAKHLEALLEKEHSASLKISAEKDRAEKVRAQRDKAEAEVKAAREAERGAQEQARAARAELEAAEARARQAKAVVAMSEAQRSAERQAGETAEARARERLIARRNAELQGEKAVRMALAEQWDGALVAGIQAVALSPGWPERVPPLALRGLVAALGEAARVPLKTFHQDRVRALACATEGARVLSVSAEGTALLWQAPEQTAREQRSEEGGIAAAAFGDARGEVIATATDGGEVQVRSQDWRVRTRFASHLGAVRWLQFSAGGERLLGVGQEGGLRLWSLAGAPHLLWQRGGTVAHAVFTPGQESVTAAIADGVWTLSGGREPERRLFNVATELTQVVIRGAVLLGAGRDGKLRLWQDGKAFRTLEGHAGGIHSAAFSPDGEYVVTASSDGTARLWDWQEAEAQTAAVLRGHEGMLTAVCFTGDGRWVVTAGQDGHVVMHRYRTADLLQEACVRARALPQERRVAIEEHCRAHGG